MNEMTEINALSNHARKSTRGVVCVSSPTRPRVTTRQITHTRVRRSKPSSPTPRRRARRSIASRARRVVVVVRVASASRARTNERMKIQSFRRLHSLERRDVARARANEIRRSTNPRSTIRALDATARTGRIGDRATRSRSRDVRRREVDESMRTNRCERTNDGFDRSTSRVRVSRLASASRVFRE